MVESSRGIGNKRTNKAFVAMVSSHLETYTIVAIFQDPFDSQSSLCEPATRLCLCEIEKSLVTVVLPSDNSVQIHCLLNGCVVEDVRKGTVSAFPRFVHYCLCRKNDNS